MSYEIPVRRILTEKDLEIFSTSATRDLILDFVALLNDAVKGKTNDEPVTVTEVSKILPLSCLLLAN